MINIKNIAIVLLLSILLISCTDNDNINKNNNITIQKTFDNKLVYKMDNAIPIQKYKNNCEKKGGDFNECGSSCGPDAELCIEVCAYTCDFKNSEETNKGNNNSEKINKKNNFSYTGNNKTELPLEVAEGFTISTFARDLPGARDIIGPDGMGNYLLSRTDKGIITMLTIGENGELKNKLDILKGLNNPHGLELDPKNKMKLFFAEEDSIKSVDLYTDASPKKLVDLPIGDRHYTRSLLFGNDGKLYISIGSTCDVCYEQNDMHGTIYRMNPDGSELEEYAKGLRNSVFMDINPITGEIWATEMGRDGLGDNTPADEINIIKDGNNYGWPVCYGKNIHDTEFAPEVENVCDGKTASHINLQAHSAPLGLSFIPKEGWYSSYGNDLLVAYHGSWDRTIPTGYKIMYFNLDDKGNEINRKEFIKGWLLDNGENVGRPVDILTLSGGKAFITDDKRGVVYKVVYEGSKGDNSIAKNKIEKDFSDDNAGINGNIVVDKENKKIIINGKAKGYWYFEGQFDVEIINSKGNNIYQKPITASGEWMTENYVRFDKTILNYEELNTNNIQVVFNKANPSGLEENEFSKTININLK